MKFIIKSTLFAIAFFYLLSVVTTNRSRRTKTATKTKNPNLFHSKMIRTLARLAPRRNVAPVAGRARRATNMGDTKKVKK